MQNQLNIDVLEVEKFKTLAQDWWDENGAVKTLHQINPLRLSFIQSQVNLYGQRVLDLGCGGGILSESLARQGGHVTGLDISDEIIQIATQHARKMHLDIQYFNLSAEAFAEKHPESFDVISCMEMLEHVPDPISIIQACNTLLKPGGHLFLSTLNRTPKSYLLGIIGAEYLLKMLPKGTHEYQKFIRPSELSHWLREQDFSVLATAGIQYSPLKKQFKLSDNVSINYLMYAKKL